MHPLDRQSPSDILQLFQKAGFTTLTPLQEKLIPLILKGKDVLADAPAGSGKTSAVVLPLILGLRGAGLAPRALILVPSVEEVGKVARAVTRFTRVVRDAPAFIPLGELEDARREQRRLEKGAALIAGTPERVIDHLRRSSLDIRELATVVVEEPRGELRADFVRDVQFIFEKLTARHHTVLFTTAPEGEQDELLELLHHPVSLDAVEGEPVPSVVGGHVVFQTAGKDKAEALARIILGRRMASVLVLCSPRTDAQRLAQALRQWLLRPLTAGTISGPSPRARTARSGAEGAPRALAALASGQADVLIAPVAASGSLGEAEGFAPSHVVYFDLPTAAGGLAGGSRAAGAPRRPSVVVALMEIGQEKELSRLQEAIGVMMKKEDIPGDDDVVTGSIDRVLRLLKDEQDKTELMRLRSRIRRQVPMLQRPLFMAYLLRAQLPPGRAPSPVRPQGAPSRPQAAPARPEPLGRAAPGDRREPAPPVTPKGGRGRFGRSIETPRPSRPAPAPGGTQDFTQLFVSIGRNRRVFARELTDLFREKLQLGAQELGSVRVFDKYSFVDIVPSRAEEAISKLSGSEVKGRTITVDYAKKKEEKGER